MCNHVPFRIDGRGDRGRELTIYFTKNFHFSLNLIRFLFKPPSPPPPPPLSTFHFPYC